LSIKPGFFVFQSVSRGRVALKPGFYTVDLDSQDATLNLDAI